MLKAGFETRVIAPFVAWMLLMTLLPPAPWAYAVRTVVTALLLALVPRSAWLDGWRASSLFSSLAWGLGVGAAVLVIWVLPEQFDWAWYQRWCIYGEGGTRAIAEASMVMVVMRLVGSAFVISAAEELFFRKWLIGFAGFWGMVALFAIEHDRFVVGAIAGIAYGLLYLRRGLLSAIVAHAFTNLALGLWVIRTGQWQFW